MKLQWKLLLGQLRRHPGRWLLTSLAIVSAAAVVVWVVSGYEALVAQFDDFSEEYLGRYQFIVAPAGPPPTNGRQAPLPASVVAELRADPDVKAVDAETHLRAEIKNAGVPDAAPTGGRPTGGFFPLTPTLVGSNAAEPPHRMASGRWFRSDAATPEAAVSSGAAAQLGVKEGDELKIRYKEKNYAATVVGIVEQIRPIAAGSLGAQAPSRGPATSAVYVSIPTAEKILGGPAEITIAQVALKEEIPPSAFLARWSPKLAQGKPALALMTAEDVEKDLVDGRAAEGARNQAYSATGVSLLAALFIIFTALSMGVDERVRQFAVLRAVSLTRGQIGMLIALESVTLGLVGWLGGLGAGWLVLKVVGTAKPDLFPGGATLGWWCVALSGVCAVGGALAAAVLPAWRAMRISPLEAMAGSSAAKPPAAGKLAILGLALAAAHPLVVFSGALENNPNHGVYVAVGCTLTAVGFILLTPFAVRSAELLLGPLVARMLGLDPRLAASDLSANLWRTVGTCVALTLGLGLFVATQIWGYTMLQPFLPGRWAPDLIVNFTTGGLPESEFAAVAHAPGIRPETCLPAAVEQPKLAQDYTRSAERLTAVRQPNVIVIGLDPTRGIGAADALLPLEFVAGDRVSAAEKMKTGRGAVVPDHFAREAKLKLGDSFAVVPPSAPGTTVSYTVAGVVKLPGWHWMTKFSGLRRRESRAGAIVFADFDVVKKDFNLPGTNFFFAQLQPGATVAPPTGGASNPTQDALGAALQEIAARHPGERQPTNLQGTWNWAAIPFGATVRLSTPNEVRARISGRAHDVLWGMSQLPLVTLAVAAIGVLNTIMASVRARSWSIGVMRSVGLTSTGLAKLILAESILIGLVACLLSLAFGMLAGWCGAGISDSTTFFSGLNPQLTIPCGNLGVGFGATLSLCLLAALGPAIHAGCTPPLQLMKAGRAAM